MSVCVCVELAYSVCMLMCKCACVPVCVAECMNYLLVISHKKHIIQTAQDKALLNPITDYNHSLQPCSGRESRAGEKEIKVSKESKKGGNEEEEEFSVVSLYSSSYLPNTFTVSTASHTNLYVILCVK